VDEGESYQLLAISHQPSALEQRKMPNTKDTKASKARMQEN